jgi:exodeoxyribonuclease V gamma subunit
MHLTTFQVGPSGIVELPAIPATTAATWLKALIQAWCEGMRRPLPLACKTAFAWLADPEDAAAIYEGNYGTRGEVVQDAYLGRAFPHFAALTSQTGEGFEYWTQQLYKPIWKTYRGEPV